jgi:UDPglucose--hexose-1-phosphate uridylyltransferase
MGVLDHPHRRRNALTGRWVLVSEGRSRRPWQGQREAASPDAPPAYDPDCPLCPGNVRAGGERTPGYSGPYAFPNDYSALRPGTPLATDAAHPLLVAAGAPGVCRVLCFSPRHDRSLGQLGRSGIRAVVDLWAGQVAELGERYRWVQLFENRGEAMGASNPHPHGQVWATSPLPDEPACEDAHQRRHLAERGVPLLVEYANVESGRCRVVAENADWIAMVPFWATWPFETLLMPRDHVPRLPALVDRQRTSLAEVLADLLGAYDRLFDRPFPYSMGWHGAPGASGDDAHWQLHAHFYPPLLRSASVRKFLVGYEMLADVQRDLSPEAAAERLRAAGAP